MGVVRMNEPPDCHEPGAAWCPACLMIAKQKQWLMYQAEIQAGYAASGDKVAYIQWPPGLTKELRAGRWRAVCGEFPMLGLVDGLCWDHVAGGDPGGGGGGLLQAPAGLLPKRGRGFGHG